MPAPASPYLAALADRIVVFDGAMGTSLQELDLAPEAFGGAALNGWIDGLVLHSPSIVAEVHRSFLGVGADVVETCTFQSTPLRLAEWADNGHRAIELNRRAAELARSVCAEFTDRPRFVAGSVGPTGFLPSSSDPSLGAITFGELVETFSVQCRGLIEGGVDLLIIETAQDILEVRAAIFGARRAFEAAGRRVPLQAQVSLDTSGRMLLGTDIGAVVTILESLDVDVIGLNCSTGPEHMREPIRYLCDNSRLPVACIPNAGIPANVGGRAHFPLEPMPMAQQLASFVSEWGVDIIGGCCGTTPVHVAQMVAAVAGARPSRTRPIHPPRLASSMRSITLVQEPAPLLIGERVNAQGSRAMKRMLLDDDYDGILTVAHHQVDGGAHALDVCVALTERSDEADQMRRAVKALQMSVDSPLVIDSTDAEVIRVALETSPGRGIVNSVNLENGRARCDAVLPLVRDHGCCVVALTIDEEGMAKTCERKLEVARRIADIACQDFHLGRDQLLFDALTFTLATGEEEWANSAIETIEGIRLIKAELPGVLSVLGVSNVSFGLKGRARQVLNSVFLYHCVAAGLDAAIINPAHVVPYAEIDVQPRRLAEDLVFNRRPDALTAFIAHFDGAEPSGGPRDREDQFANMAPPERIHQQILRRKKEGIEEQIDLALTERDPVAVLNEILLPAMKDVGDRFGAGELILPFVLQSAEVMKRAVAHLENYLEKSEGYTKGRVVLATVYGDVHDIGKNLVNTILSNNGYTVYDLGKQVPLNTIIDKAQEVGADAIALSALLVSTSKQMPLCVQELDQRGLCFPVIIGGAAINRGFGRRILYVGDQRVYEPGVFYCKDAFEGLDTMDQLIDAKRRPELLERIRAEAAIHREREANKLAQRAVSAAQQPVSSGPGGRSVTRQDAPIPTPPFWGPTTVEGIPAENVRPYIDRNSLFKMSWQFRGVRDPDQWKRLVVEELEPRLQRSMDEASRDGWLDLRAVYGYWPALGDGNDVIVYDPHDHEREIARFSFPRQSAQNRLCLADYVRPRGLASNGERDVVALQVVTTGPQASVLSNRLQRDGHYDDMLRVHGFATQMAEATAELIHHRIRRELNLEPEQGRRYSWGYPACPDLEDHRVFFAIVPADRIGVELTDGFQMVPEQSTAAIVMHHPEARYFAVYSAASSDSEPTGPGAPEAAA